MELAGEEARIVNQDEAIEIVQRYPKTARCNVNMKLKTAFCASTVGRQAFYVPGPDNRAVQQPEGKQRLVIYGVCPVVSTRGQG